MASHRHNAFQKFNIKIWIELPYSSKPVLHLVFLGGEGDFSEAKILHYSAYINNSTLNELRLGDITRSEIQPMRSHIEHRKTKKLKFETLWAFPNFWVFQCLVSVTHCLLQKLWIFKHHLDLLNYRPQQWLREGNVLTGFHWLLICSQGGIGYLWPMSFPGGGGLRGRVSEG